MSAVPERDDPAARASPQLPLALRYPPDQRLETWIAPPTGAAALVRATARGERVEWLYLTGPAGVGKTHVLLGACAEAEACGRRAAYLPLAVARGRLAQALAALEGHDLIALDGVEAIAGAREDEVALFDAHNRARAAGSTVLYAARDIPDALGLTLPDLRSRLAQCARIALAALDDDGRREVLRQRAQRRGLVLDDAALDWLLRRAQRDLASLTGLLDQLDRASLAAQRRITVPFLRQTLGGEL
ncbi:MAG TPA: DnaA regulatory inactivator Hda [Lysobacter sp.]|nr:DnaA regulatory inactivator Hda [Lysobacter sp.]